MPPNRLCTAPAGPDPSCQSLAHADTPSALVAAVAECTKHCSETLRRRPRHAMRPRSDVRPSCCSAVPISRAAPFRHARHVPLPPPRATCASRHHARRRGNAPSELRARFRGCGCSRRRRHRLARLAGGVTRAKLKKSTCETCANCDCELLRAHSRSLRGQVSS
eukprot:SAG11_NODE_489_length_8994_cov_8.385904_5_plen_164_part_00